MLSLAGAKLHLIFLICKILGSFFNGRAPYFIVFGVFGSKGRRQATPLIIFLHACIAERTRALYHTDTTKTPHLIILYECPQSSHSLGS